MANEETKDYARKFDFMEESLAEQSNFVEVCNFMLNLPFMEIYGIINFYKIKEVP